MFFSFQREVQLQQVNKISNDFYSHSFFIEAAGISSLAVSWPTTNQLLIYKIAKSEAKGKGIWTTFCFFDLPSHHVSDAFDTRPISIWPFASRITSFTYDSKHEHLAVALQSGNVCIIERTTGVNDLPSIQNISSSSILNIHAIDSLEYPLNLDVHDKHHGFLVLPNDGNIYRVKFQSVLTEEKQHEARTILPCFPQ